MASPKRKPAAEAVSFDSVKRSSSIIQARKKVKAPQENMRLVKLLEARQGVVFVFVVEQRNEFQDAFANSIFARLARSEHVVFGDARMIARVFRRNPAIRNHALENDERGYLRRSMLTIRDGAWTAENKLELAEAVRDHLNEADSNDPMSTGANRYVVPDNFDETPGRLMPLEEYMLFNAVVAFIKSNYSCENGYQNWYLNNIEIADDFFCRPYPNVARIELGYPVANLDAQN